MLVLSGVGGKEHMSKDAGAGAPEEEIEITPEMIEAGYLTLIASGVVDDPLEADKVTVAEIFEAMLRARPRRTSQIFGDDV
jgi:hypothetical protein